MTALENVTWEQSPMEVPREGPPWRRPLVKLSPGAERLVPHTRATTWVDAPDDKTPLDRYHQRKVARGLVKQSHLYRAVAALGDMPEDEEAAKTWKQKMDELCRAAQTADGADQAASDGTTLHTFTQRLNLGQDISDLPDEFRPHIEAYRKATAHLTCVYIERFMVNDELRVGGTPDRILKIPGYDKLIIGDVKTGSLDYGQGKMAAQLALYAHSKLYDPRTGERAELDIDQERGLIIALNLKTAICELKWIDLKLGWEGVLLAGEVRAWRRKRKFTMPYDEDPGLYDTDLVAVAREELIMRINNAESPEALIELWRMAGTAWTPEHTTLAAHRKAELAA